MMRGATSMPPAVAWGCAVPEALPDLSAEVDGLLARPRRGREAMPDLRRALDAVIGGVPGGRRGERISLVELEMLTARAPRLRALLGRIGVSIHGTPNGRTLQWAMQRTTPAVRTGPPVSAA